MNSTHASHFPCISSSLHTHHSPTTGPGHHQGHDQALQPVAQVLRPAHWVERPPHAEAHAGNTRHPAAGARVLRPFLPGSALPGVRPLGADSHDVRVQLHQVRPSVRLGLEFGCARDRHPSICVLLNADPTSCLHSLTQSPTRSAVQQGRVMATQFHPEKSGTTGLRILKAFLDK